MLGTGHDSSRDSGHSSASPRPTSTAQTARFTAAVHTKRGFELVGISQRGLGRPPACTRIVPYREWVEEQIRVASGRP